MMAEMNVLEHASGIPESGIFTVESEIGLRKCIQCGDCSGICPFGYLMEYPPSRMISVLRANNFGRVTASDSVWMCIACSACTTVCPTQIPVTVDLMTRTKEILLLNGNVPSELQSALENSQRYGNPLGESPRKRIDWIKGADSPVPIFGKDTREADVLWFVGDYPAYHPRVQATARAMAHILHGLKINFAVLGVEESSDGDSQRLAGEHGLFEMLAEKNGKAFRKYRFNRIITTDPHAYNALKNEYPKLEIAYPVQHYTEFLVENLAKLKPHLVQEVEAKVTYHDPCYLGRVNGIFDAPRTLLSAIPGVTLVEMSHHHKNSLCCGGGGGGMWLDGWQWEKAHTRLSEWRVREAVQAGADILALACPYEAPRFEDAVKTLKLVDKINVKDISELLAESMNNK
jgi:Fe-S oxidoreductase